MMDDEFKKRSAEVSAEAERRGLERCPLGCCNHRINPWRHTLCHNQTGALAKLYAHPKEIVHVGEWGLLRNEGTNKTRLYYWGLAEKMSGKGMRGKSRITQHGIDWIEGRIKVPSHCTVKHKKVLFFEGPPVSFTEAAGMPQMTVEDYLAQLRAA